MKPRPAGRLCQIVRPDVRILIAEHRAERLGKLQAVVHLAALRFHRRQSYFFHPAKRIGQRKVRIFDSAGAPADRVAALHHGLLRVQQPVAHPFFGLLSVMSLAHDDARKCVRSRTGALTTEHRDKRRRNLGQEPFAVVRQRRLRLLRKVQGFRRIEVAARKRHRADKPFGFALERRRIARYLTFFEEPRQLVAKLAGAFMDFIACRSVQNRGRFLHERQIFDGVVKRTERASRFVDDL